MRKHWTLEPHWRCEATLEDTVQLGTSLVSCEGYRTNSDPYVLRGSCGLAYSLEYTTWGPYLWGKTVKALSILIWTPLKWLGYTTVGLLVGLVILTLVRRPALRARHHATHEKKEVLKKRPPPRKVKYVEDEDVVDLDEEDDFEEEFEEEEDDTVWSGRLRSSVGKAGR